MQFIKRLIAVSKEAFKEGRREPSKQPFWR